MIKPKILVVTATLGNRISLDKTIKSVQSIGGTNVQHLIVAPFDKIEQLKSQYDFLWYLAEPKDQKGIYPALNLAFNKYGRDFDYLTFINDDDYWLTDFKVLIDTIIRENYDLVYARTCYVNDADAFISEQSSSGQFKKFIGLLKSSGIVLFTQQATIIKSSLFFEVGGFDETYKLVADSKFWMQLSLMNIKYKYINKVCAAYMLQEGQLSSDHSLQAIEHSRLFDEFPCIKPASFIDVLKFRSINAHIYMKRILKFKKIHNPFFAPPCLMILTLMPWCLKR